MAAKVGEVPPRHISAHSKPNVRLVTLISGAMRICMGLRDGQRVQGVSRKEWRAVMATVHHFTKGSRRHLPNRIVGKEG